MEELDIDRSSLLYLNRRADAFCATSCIFYDEDIIHGHMDTCGGWYYRIVSLKVWRRVTNNLCGIIILIIIIILYLF